MIRNSEENVTATNFFYLKLCGKRNVYNVQDYVPLQHGATNNLTNSHNFKILN